VGEVPRTDLLNVWDVDDLVAISPERIPGPHVNGESG
jgi:hypothetical protein